MSDITVIVPCFNVENELPRCIDSLLVQTIPVDIILVNDGSTDLTLDVANMYAARYPNILVLSKENQGLPQARKCGIEHANSLYVGFVDSDDWIEPKMYERLYQALTNADADIAVCGMYKTYERSGDIIEMQRLKTGTVLAPNEALHYLHCRQDVFPYMWNKLYRRELFNRVEFPTGNFTGEDYVTQIQILGMAKRITVVNEPLYHYWQRATSMSRGGFQEGHLISYQQYGKVAEQLIAANPALVHDVHCYMAVEYMAYIIAMSRNKNYNYEILKETQKYIRTNLLGILGNEDFSLLYKGCAVAVAIHYKLLTGVYHFVKK